MDRDYILWQLNQRIPILKKRYHQTINNTELTKGGSAYQRSIIKRDLQICILVEEIVNALPQLVDLSDDALEGLERLMEPMERHRRLRADAN